MSSDSFSSLSSGSGSPHAACVAVLSIPKTYKKSDFFEVEILPQGSPSDSSCSDDPEIPILPLPTSPTNEGETGSDEESHLTDLFPNEDNQLSDEKERLRTASTSDLSPQSQACRSCGVKGSMRTGSLQTETHKPALPISPCNLGKKQSKLPPPAEKAKPKQKVVPCGAGKPANNGKSERNRCPRPTASVFRKNPRRSPDPQPTFKPASNKTSQRILELRFRKEFEGALSLLQVTSATINFSTFTALLQALHFTSDHQTKKKSATACWSYLSAASEEAVENIYGFLCCVVGLGAAGGFPKHLANECHLRFFELYLARRNSSCKTLPKTNSVGWLSGQARAMSVGRTVRTEDYVYAANLKRKRKRSPNLADLKVADYFLPDSEATPYTELLQNFWDILVPPKSEAVHCRVVSSSK